MERLSIKLDECLIEISLPPRVVLEIFSPSWKSVPLKLKDFEKALEFPVTGPSFNKFLEEVENSFREKECRESGRPSLGIVVNDADRPTPADRFLDALLPVLDSRGTLFDIEILFATGSHRKPSENEVKAILGRHFSRFKNHLFFHDARDGACMVHAGVSSRKTPVILSRKLFEKDAIILTGSVEPHYFAGLTGGVKGIAVGLAGIETIEANHRHALSPDAQILRTKGNPVWEDLQEIYSFLDKPVFSLQSVQHGSDTISIAAGPPAACQEKLAHAIREHSVFEFEEPADLVIAAVEPPLSLTLYQALKGVENNLSAVKDGGSLLLVASLKDGTGPSAFLEPFRLWEKPEDIIEGVQKNYRLGWHKASKLVRAGMRIRLNYFSERPVVGIPDNVMRRCNNIEKFVHELVQAEFDKKSSKKNFKINYIQDAGNIASVYVRNSA